MAKVSYTFLLWWLLQINVVFSQNYNRPVPSQVPAYEFVQHDSTQTGYYLTAPFGLNAGNGPMDLPPSTMVLDADGYLFWYQPVAARNLLDFTFHPEHDLYTYVKFVNPQNVQYMLMNRDFEVVDSFTTTNGISPDIHDFQITANKTFLLAGASDSIMDLSAYPFNGMPGSATTHVIGFVVQEFDEDHNLLFQWNSNDHIPPQATYPFYGYNAAAFDYCHGNSIEEDVDGNLLLSFRHLNAVYKIDRQSGKVLWRLGGRTSSFTFTNDQGFSGQHDVRRLPNGNIALFDNANMGPLPRVSRAVEYRLDTLNWTATKVWEYKYDPEFFSRAMGGHQTTDHRQHLINYGLNFRPEPSFVRTDDAGQLLSELFFQDSIMSYRSSLFDLPVEHIERPVITCSQDGGTVTLSAPSGQGRYEWSTGETAPTINVSETGAYQVWIPQGIGMLGSKPFVIQDLAAACPTSVVKEVPETDSELIVGYFDLLGRRIAPLQNSGSRMQIYVVQYASGRVRLINYH